MVGIARFTSRVCYFFRLVRIECYKTVAGKDVMFLNQNRRQKVFNRGLYVLPRALTLLKLDQISTDL